jgi:hypothetical protein
MNGTIIEKMERRQTETKRKKIKKIGREKYREM